MDQFIQLYDVREISALTSDRGELGSGSFGSVRLARHSFLQEIAVKCFHISGGELEKNTIEKSIKEELEILRKISHNNIVKVYGWTKWSESMGILMEYLPSGNLKNLLFNIGVEIGLGLRLRMCTDISSGLTSLHNFEPTGKRQLIHGDLKPENVILDKDLHCKIADFGSARISTKRSVQSTNTINKNKQFTQVYAAPERLKQHGTELRKEHDTYSFAMIIYMSVARNYPFDVDADRFIEGVKKGQRPDLGCFKKLLNNLDETDDTYREIIKILETEMVKCWDHDPSKRPFMFNVTNRLNQVLNKIPHHKILIQAAKASEQLELTPPDWTDNSTVKPLEDFSTSISRFLQIPCQSSPVQHQPDHVGSVRTEQFDPLAYFLPSLSTNGQNSSLPASSQDKNALNSSTDVPSKFQFNSKPMGKLFTFRGSHVADENNIQNLMEKMTLHDNKVVSKSVSFPHQSVNQPQVVDPNRGHIASTSLPVGQQAHVIDFNTDTTQPKSLPVILQNPSEPTHIEDQNNSNFAYPQGNNVDNHIDDDFVSSIKDGSLPLSFQELFNKSAKSPESEVAWSLVVSFTGHLRSGKFDAARATVPKVVRWAQKLKAKSKAKLAKGFANTHRNEGRYLEAVLFFEVAQQLYRPPLQERNLKNYWVGTAVCLDEVMTLARGMPVENRPITKGYLLENVSRLHDEIKAGAEPGKFPLILPTCLRCLAACHQAVGHVDKASNCLETATSDMEQNLKDSARYLLYGESLHDLGRLHADLDPHKSRQYFERALEAKKQATDYTREEAKEKSVEETRRQIV